MKSAAGNVMAILAGLAVPAYAGTSFVSKWAAKDAQAGSFQGKKVIAVFMDRESPIRSRGPIRPRGTRPRRSDEIQRIIPLSWSTIVPNSNA